MKFTMVKNTPPCVIIDQTPIGYKVQGYAQITLFSFEIRILCSQSLISLVSKCRVVKLWPVGITQLNVNIDLKGPTQQKVMQRKAHGK